jgi:diguanylate cyclase (GGDEF)-like protein
MRARLLIVDHNPQDQVVLRGLLQDEYEIHVAVEDDEALRLAAFHRPNLILLDLALDGGDPATIFARLRSNVDTADLPVIAVTAFDNDEEAAHWLAKGAADYLTKPYHPALVKSRLRHHAELARARLALNAIAQTDQLTQTATGRVFNEALNREWRRCGRAGTYLSLLMIEVDQLQEYEARHGKTGADRCLQEIATRIALSIHRQPDLLARYDEVRFACLLPDTSPVGAISVAQRLQEAMVNLPRPVTISQGIATLLPTTESAPADLLLQGEELLALAKHHGGNRMCDEGGVRSVYGNGN